MNGQFKKVNVTKRFLLFLRTASLVFLCAVFLLAQSVGRITAKDPKAKEAVDAAIKAIGGAEKTNGIKSLIIKGTAGKAGTALIDGIPVKVEATILERRILLPDNYIIIQNRMGMIGYDGVSRGTLIWPRPRMSTTLAKVAPPEKIELLEKDDATLDNHYINEKTDELSRLLIGTLMIAGPAPLTISSGSKPGVFTLTKKDGVLGEIEFDSKNGYPSVIRYKAAEEPKMLSGAINVGGIGSAGAGAGQASDKEIRFQDRFPVNGIMFPKVIITTQIIGEQSMEIEEVQINPKLTLKDFEIPKQ